MCAFPLIFITGNFHENISSLVFVSCLAALSDTRNVCYK